MINNNEKEKTTKDNETVADNDVLNIVENLIMDLIALFKGNETIADNNNLKGAAMFLGSIVSFIVYGFIKIYFAFSNLEVNYVIVFLIVVFVPTISKKSKIYWFIIGYCLGYLITLFYPMF